VNSTATSAPSTVPATAIFSVLMRGMVTPRAGAPC
jgi:hypothetical protein